MSDKYRRWKLNEGDIDPNDPKWGRRNSERLDRTLSVLATHVPELCVAVKIPFPAQFQYNYHVDGPIGSLTYQPNQCAKRHGYHVSPAVWITPECEACEAEFEHQVSVSPERWRKRENK